MSDQIDEVVREIQAGDLNGLLNNAVGKSDLSLLCLIKARFELDRKVPVAHPLSQRAVLFFCWRKWIRTPSSQLIDGLLKQ